MLGKATACLECEDSSINESKVDSLKMKTEMEMQQFAHDSGEYQILNLELKRLVSYQARTISKTKKIRAKK